MVPQKRALFFGGGGGTSFKRCSKKERRYKNNYCLFFAHGSSRNERINTIVAFFFFFSFLIYHFVHPFRLPILKGARISHQSVLVRTGDAASAPAGRQCIPAGEQLAQDNRGEWQPLRGSPAAVLWPLCPGE